MKSLENNKHGVESDNYINMTSNNDYSRYGFLVTYFTIAVDLAICVGAFLMYSRLCTIDIDIRVVQSVIVMAVVYAACLLRGGVVLHRRASKGFSVLLIIMRNTAYFAILSSLLLRLGGFLALPASYTYLFYTTIAICSLIFRLSLRSFFKNLYMKDKYMRHVVIVGTSNSCINMYEEMVNSIDGGYVVDGYFEDAPCNDMPEECRYLGKSDEVIDYLKRNDVVKEVYYGKMSKDNKQALALIRYCQNHIVHCFIIPDMEGSFRQRIYYNTLGAVIYFSFERDPLMRVENKLLKRAFDVVVSSVFLVTLFPVVFLLVSIISSITMPGPIFFRQKRTGVNGKDFYCLKFRSMKVNKEADSMQATKNDPRKTKWGNIMRKTNIDELPQFINVLMGDMSVVGPRPHMLRHTEEYSQLIDKYMMRHFIKPGITGWSQVTGYRGETKELSQMEGRIRGDIWYVEHWSIWLDIYIILKTVANLIIGDKNAY